MGNMTYHTGDGWKSSVVGENIVEQLMVGKYTVPEIKAFSLKVKADCRISINGGDPVWATAELGTNYSELFKPVKSVEFLDAGINYFIAYGI